MKSVCVFVLGILPILVICGCDQAFNSPRATSVYEERGVLSLSPEYGSGGAYIRALQKRGICVSVGAGKVLEQLKHIPKERRVRLKKVTLADLGLSDGSTNQVLNAAKAQGLELCPPWVGPQYRMECGYDESIVIGMEPMTSLDTSHTYVFAVYRTDHGDCWLHSFADAGSFLWDSDDEFLFVVSRK